MTVLEILNDRVKMLRDLGVKVVLDNSSIRWDKDNKKLVRGLTEKKTMAFLCQCMGIEKIKSFSPQLKQNWQNTCKAGLQMMYDNEVDDLMRVAKFSGETYEMKYLSDQIKNENHKNQETLEFIFENLQSDINSKLYIK